MVGKKEDYLNEIWETISHGYRPYTREVLPLAKAYTEGNLCVVLGAGVSVDSNIPQWNELVFNLMVNTIQRQFSYREQLSGEQLKELSHLTLDTLKASPLVQMRFIKSSIGVDDKEFIRMVHDSLYCGSINYNTPILNSIRRLCEGIKECDNYRGAVLKKIITYNFDNVLEQILRKNELKYNVIFDENGTYSPESVNVYHVHGYIPFEEGGGISNIVFSEEDYHQIYNSVYHWSNIIQLNSFREDICLFIGCSLTDPNIRRLLDASGKKKRHYAILKRERIEVSFLKDVENDFVGEYIKLNEKMIEDYYSSLGIKIIWVNEFWEIPEVINAITPTIMYNGFLLEYIK